MWRKLLRPEVVFLFGTLQALIPYFAAFTGITPPEVNVLLSPYPLFIWIIGYVFFWIGTRLGPRKIPESNSPMVPVSMSFLKGSLLLLISGALIEMVGLIRLYGGIPLLAFASGQLNVSETNELQTQSGFGQVGAAGLTVFLLVGVICLIAIKARKEGLSVARWVSPALLFTFLMTTFEGKRQGLFMCLLIVACCSTIAFGSPFDLIGAFLPLKIKKKRGRFLVVVLIGASVFGLISGLAALRTGGADSRTAAEELGLYYEWPILNMSYQSVDSGGFGPYKFKPLGVIKTLLPAKVSFLDESAFGTDPTRFEITSPSGFYERLQWDLGLWGIILFNILCGLFCQVMYRWAFRRHAAMLAYAFITWALFSAALYNHFLNLLFLPLPAVIFFVTSFVNREMRRAYRHANRGGISGLNLTKA
jgi:oligosaccharide repeat unit polymerase